SGLERKTVLRRPAAPGLHSSQNRIRHRQRQVGRKNGTLLVNFNRLNQQIAVSQPLVVNLKVDDDLSFRFLQLDQLAEFIRLSRLAFTDYLRCGLEDAEQLVGAGIAFQYPG